MIERLWVEVNSRVNFPIKETLIQLENDGAIDMGNEMCKFSVSWFCIEVASVGIKLFISSWNNHPIPGVNLKLKHLYLFHFIIILQVDAVEH